MLIIAGCEEVDCELVWALTVELLVCQLLRRTVKPLTVEMCIIPDGRNKWLRFNYGNRMPYKLWNTWYLYGLNNFRY